LAREGADIIAIDICRQAATVPFPMATSADLAETVKEVEALDRRIIAAEVDIRDLAMLTAVVDSAVAELGRLDIVVANAGISSMGRALELDEQTWDEMIEINLTGAWKTVKSSVPHIVRGGRGGAVVIISSRSAMTVSENIAHYTAAKAGLIGLMKVLAKELSPHRIRVNTIHPGAVATPMIHNEATYRLHRPDLDHPTREQFEDVSRSLNPLGVPALEPEDVSSAVLYLVSDAGRYVTGITHMVDAGGQLR
jgi:(+)-trans-carveol dehydrogenase